MTRNVIKAILNALRRAKIDRLRGERTWRRVPRGFSMWIDPREGMGIGHYLDTYERALMRSIDLLVEPGDAAVDVGTHKGYVTLSLAKRVGVAGKVVSVDPDQRVYLELVENCARNAFTHVTTLPIAIGECEGICEIAITSDLANSSHFPNANARAAVKSVVTVPMKRLDDVLETEGMLGGSRPITFVKVDAEGSEPLILRGVERTLGANPAVYITPVQISFLRNTDRFGAARSERRGGSSLAPKPATEASFRALNRAAWSASGRFAIWTAAEEDRGLIP